MLRLQDKNWFIVSASILTIVFALLKYFTVIHWSLWWVFAPLWLPILMQLVINFIQFRLFKKGKH